MADILPYLGIEPDYTLEELANMDAAVPNVIGLTLEQAKAKMEKAGFAFRTVGTGETVTDQTPAGGAIVPNSATIVLYMGEKAPKDLCTVPNVVGLTAEQANKALADAGLIMRIAGITTTESRKVHAIAQ